MGLRAYNPAIHFVTEAVCSLMTPKKIPKTSELQKNLAAFAGMISASCLLLILFAAGPARAIDGRYMGVWATDKEACGAKSSPERWLLQQTELLSPQFRCKLLGLRQDDQSGMTFMASCHDASTKWNDEIALSASQAEMFVTLKSDGQKRQFVRCL